LALWHYHAHTNTEHKHNTLEGCR